MRCEVCGRKIYGKPCNVIIEGAKLTVCGECSKHGKVLEEKTQPATLKTIQAKPKTLPTSKTQQKGKPEIKPEEELELVEDFNVKIRQAREKLGLTHENLGKRLNEKVSVLRKIETSKMTPNNILARKLEHELKIKLLVPASRKVTPQIKIPKPEKRELTLGDIIQLNKKDNMVEETAERKQS